MNSTVDTGSSKFFGEDGQKMITVSGAIEQEFYNNNPSYNGMIFISIQSKNQQGSGFSKDTKVTSKLDVGEAMRFASQVKDLVVQAGEGFKKSYQTDSITFDFSVNIGQNGPQIYIAKNQQQQGSVMTAEELLDIAGYVEAKAISVESLAGSFSAGIFQFNGRQNQRQTGQQNGYGGQQNGYGGQQNGYGGQQNGYGGQQNGYGGQQNGYGGQQNGHGGQQQHTAYYSGETTSY